MFKRTAVAAAMALALASGAAQAVKVADTGTPTYNPAYGYQFNSAQFFAGEFSLDSSAIINSIEGYFSTAAGVVGISLYSDGGDVPGSLLYTTNVTTTAGGLAWNGASSLGWSVASGGDYWVAFSPSYVGGLTEMPGGAPSPLAAYAHTQAGSWFSSNEGVGMRIDATVAAVPEPTSIAMYALGLVGLAAVARRKQA